MIFRRLIIISVLVFGSSTHLFSQIKVNQYDLDFQFDFENERLSCVANLSINGSGDTLNLLLYRLLKVTSVTDTSGNNVDFTQEVVSIGKLIKTEQKTGGVKYKYQSIVPSWRIDLAIGKYKTLSFDNFKIHYFEEDSVGAQRVLSTIRQTKMLYDNWFGKKELNDFTVIEVLEGYGSQTDACGIIQTSTAFKNPKYTEELYHEISHL